MQIREQQQIHHRIAQPPLKFRDAPVPSAKDTPVLPKRHEPPIVSLQRRPTSNLTIGSTVLGEYATCNLFDSSRERATETNDTKKRKSDAPFGPHEDDGGCLFDSNDEDSHIKRDDDIIFERDNNENARKIWPENLIQHLQDIMALPCQNPSKPLFEFDLSVEAAEKNYILLMRKFGGDLHRALHAQKDSPLSYGSEFKPVSTLETIFSLHPNWQRMKIILLEGSTWPLSPLDEAERLKDIDDALEFGNHKGAVNQKELLLTLVNDDVVRGFALPLPLDKIKKVPGVILAPLNIQLQKTINERGEIIPKNRLTHDQSWAWQSGTSVNDRVDTSKLMPCYFGSALKRIINWAVAARKKYPGKRILATKLDIKAAFRRCHLNAETAVQTCTQLPDLRLALMMLRLSFGGAPCPSVFGTFSESICDLIIAILLHDNWDPLTLFAKEAQAHVPPKEVLPEDVHFGIGRDLIVDIPIDPRGTVDVYIDDFLGLTIDLEDSDNSTRLERAPLLGLTAVSREVAKVEPLPRDEMDARKKLVAETGLTEIKIMLGWEIDFRRMTIALMDNKFIAYSKAITDMLERSWTNHNELETNVGRWVHMAQIIPFVHHFLSRIRFLMKRAKYRRSIEINATCRDDLTFILHVMKICNAGVDLNSIAYRRPTHAYRSDSCPRGLGGYSHQGFAWRFYLDPELQFRASNNLLEHLAAIITPWVDLLAGRLKNGDCALSMTDSSTSEGWLRKTNFIEDGEDPIQATIRLEVARLHASHYLSHGVREYSQWFRGSENPVADALSRDDDRSDEELTHILRTHCHSQIPQHFVIVPLPKEITSWLTSLLQRLPVKQQLVEKHTRTKLGRGTATHDGASLSASETTLSSTDSPDNIESRSWAPLPWLSVKDGFLDEMMIPWLKNQSQIPSTLWLRPSESMDAKTQRKTSTITLHDFYADN